jgi:DNA-binding SARP family transcriptional activator
LAFLLLHPNLAHTREYLADLLWPNAPPDRVRRNFSDTLYRLRQGLGEAWLLVEPEKVSLNPDADLWVDVWEFEQLLKTNDPATLTKAVELYTGDLLPEIYDDWILARRVALQESYLATLPRLGQTAEQQGQLENAFEYYHLLAHADPLNEEGHRGLMRVYARLGRHNIAWQQYEYLTQLLADELQGQPSPETQALAAALQAEYQLAPAELRPPQPFVGRQKERTSLLRWAELTQAGRGRLILVEGEPGAGKTRLLEALAEGAAWRGLSVAWGNARELAAVTPYTPLDQALQAALAGPRADQLRSCLSPAVIETLAGIVPRLRTGAPMQFSTLPNLPAALVEGLRTLTELRPHLFILDDVQWAGPAFWEAFQFATHLAEMHLLLVLAYRPNELRTDVTAWDALCTLDRNLHPKRIQLGGLTLAECSEMACELGYTLPANQLAILHQITHGNPLHFQEALAAQAGRSSQTASLEDLLQRRVADLTLQARAALEIAAVLGREFTHEVWQATSGSAVLLAISELIATRFIQETQRGYSFQHDLIRKLVYQSIPPNRLGQLHRRAGEILLHEHAPPETLAWHFEKAEAWSQAVHYHRLAGEQAMRAYAHRAALDHFNRAIALLPLPHDVQADYLSLLCSRQRVFRIVMLGGQLEDWRADVAEIERVATAAKESSAQLEALEARLRLNVIDSDVIAMRATAERAVALAHNLDDPVQEARLLNTLGFYLADLLGQYPEALRYLQRAVELAEVGQEFSVLIEARCNQAFALLLSGQGRRAQATAAQALALAELRAEQYPARAHALATLGHIAIQLAEWEQAYSTLRRAIGLYEELFDNWNVAEVSVNLTLVASIIGQHQEAIQAGERLVAMADQVGLLPDSDVGIWYRAVLTRAYVEAKQLAAAERVFQALQTNIAAMGDSRAALSALTTLGQLCLAQRRSQEAAAFLSKAVHLWERIPVFTDMACLLLHTLAAWQAGDLPAAKTSLTRAEQALAQSDFVRFKVQLHFVRFELFGVIEDLQAARQEIQRQAILFSDEKLREDFLEQVPLHREIESRWQALQAKPTVQIVRLARLDAPLGRALHETEQVEVRWTVDAGEADAAVLRGHGKAALRQHRLRRLLTEAGAQDAAPTDDDLAQALGVSRRTILRDMAALAQAGLPFPTRRRK